MLKNEIITKTKKLKLLGILEFVVVMTTFILIAAPLSLAIETPMTQTMSYLLILIVPALFLLAKRHSKREKKAVKEILESSEELNQGLKSQDLTLEDTIGKKLD